MNIEAIRGAITVNENTEKDIENATIKLFNAIVQRNKLDIADIAYINFSTTKDITKAYPAKFIRTSLKITNIPMMCYQEMDVEGSLKKCIRILIVLSTINANKKPVHVYLDGAEILRPDLKNN